MGKVKNWKKKPIEDGVSSGCLCCGVKGSKLSMDRPLAVGFGGVMITRNGETIWSGDDMEMTVQHAEDMAVHDARSDDKNPDWRITFDAPLWSGTWQRHDKESWMLIEKGLGFA